MAEQTNDPIDEIAVKLSLDSSAFASDLDSTMKDAEDRAQGAAEKIQGAFSGLSAGDKLTGLNIAATAEKAGISVEAVAKSLVDMNLAGGQSIEQLTALGKAAQTADFDMTDLADVVKLAGDQLGVAFSPEVTSAMAAGLEPLIGEEGGLAAAYRAALDQGQKFIEANPLVKWGKDVEAAIAEVTEAWKEHGKALPTEAVDQLRQKYAQLTGEGERTGKTDDEIRGGIDKLTNSLKGAAEGSGKMNNMQRALSMGMTTMLRMLSPILVAYKIFGAIVKELNEELKIAAASMQVVATNQVKVAQLTRQGFNMGGAGAALAQGVAQKQNVGAIGVQQTFGATVSKGAAAGLNTKQMYDLIDAATTFAKVYGTDATAATNTFIAAIESGNTDALQAFGIHLDDADVYAEALAMGLVNLGDELTAQNKKLVIQNVLLREADKVFSDYTETQTEYVKKQAQVTAELEGTKAAVGTLLTPLKALWDLMTSRVLLAGLQLAYMGFLLFGKGVSFAAATLATFVNNSVELFKWVEGKVTTEELTKFFDPKAVADRFNWVYNEMQKGFTDLVTGMVPAGDAAEKAAEDAAAGVEDAAKHALGVAGLLAAEGNRIIESHKDDTEAILQSWKDSIAQINADYMASVTAAAASLATDLAAIDEAFNNSTEQAQREHNKTMARMAEDHAVEMRRLEEDTQLDLEDAVRERDARAIRDILKRYRIERDRREEDYQINRRRRNEDYADQMAEMRRQYLLRRAERQRQFEDEIAQAKAEKERRAAEADERYAKDMAELKARIMAEFEAYLKANSDLLGAHGDMLGAMYDQLNAALGPGGWAEAFWQRYLAIIQGVYASIAGAGGYVGGDQPYGPGGGSRARGGTFFATGPSTLAVGEIPERVDITPMSRQGTGADRRGGGRDKITVALNIGLDDGLVAKVVDQSMQGVAEVIVEVSKGRR